MKRFILAFLATIGLSAMTFAADAQNPVSATQPVATPTTDTTATGNGLPFTVTATVDMPSAYYFRGDKVIGNSFIVQPFVQVTLNPINITPDLTVSPYMSGFLDLASNANGHKSWSKLSEVDYIPGLDFSYKRFDLNVSYVVYTYPNGSATYSQEFDAVLTYNDAKQTDGGDAIDAPLFAGITYNPGQLSPIALNPHISFAQTTYESDHRHPTYLELGVAPKLELPWYKIELTVPAIIGMSPNSYFSASGATNNGPFFGYGSIGLNAKLPIGDHFDIHGGVTYDSIWAKNLRVDNGGSANAVVGSIGVGFSW